MPYCVRHFEGHFITHLKYIQIQKQVIGFTMNLAEGELMRTCVFQEKDY